MQAGVDALSEGFALFDADEALLYCNAAFRDRYADLAGFLEPGLSWRVFLNEAQRRHNASELAQLDAHLDSGLEMPLTLDASRRGARWFRTSLHPVKGGGFVLTESDMTDQQQASEIIEHADDLLRGILDACASRIALVRLSDGSIQYRTPAWDLSFGVHENLQTSFQDQISYSEFLTELLPTGSLDDHETPMIRSDEQQFPARLSARGIEYQDEAAMVVSIEDLSLVHEQRDEIVRINQRLLDAIEALDQGFVLYDAEHNLVMANQRFQSVNHPVADYLLPGTPNSEIIAHCEQTDHQPQAAGWPNPDKASVNAQYEFNLDEEAVFSASRQATSDGGFVLAWRDITQQKQIEAELQRRREAAFQNEKLNALGQLLAGVAHELNNPLSVVVGHAMMMRDDVSDPDVLDSVEKISRSAERCAKIVKTFLAMARQQPAELVQVALNDIVSSAVEIASYGKHSDGLDIQLNLAPDLPLLELDETQITQVFINLFVNADHALATAVSSPCLRISTNINASGDAVIARVSDNGPGIPENIRNRIFEPFYTTKAVDEGTGVGLALSHRIISSHGGRLTLAESELGGATFEIELSIPHSLADRSTETTTEAGRQSLKALLIEDEPDVAEMFERVLSSRKLLVTVAYGGDEALKSLEEDAAVDLIFCDLRMPTMSGLQFLQAVSDRWPALSDRFIFVTGDAIGDEAARIRQEAKHPLLEKPVAPVELDLAIQTLLRAPVSNN
ncbi:MAG: PAS-domain containing protein [Granulosicoccus sp.]|nr:PAS-domain containing protein [Granulosicoccus sp.]